MCSSFIWVTHLVNGSQFYKCSIGVWTTTCSCYISCYKNRFIWRITNISSDNFCLKFKAWINFIFFTIFCFILIINNIPLSCCKFRRLIVRIIYQSYNLLCFHYLIVYIYMITKLNKKTVKIEMLFLLIFQW